MRDKLLHELRTVKQVYLEVETMHYRFTRPDVSIMLHVPKLVDNYSTILLMALRNFLDIFYQHFSSIREEWFVNLMSGPEELFIPPKELKTWAKDAEYLAKDTCSVRMNSTILLGNHKVKYMKIYANVQPSAIDNSFMINEERIVRITIPRDIWDEIYGANMRNVIMKLCYALHVTYACIDVSALCPRSIYDDSLYLWSDQSDDVLDREIYLPGIHWGLFIPYRMIESTGTIDYIMNNLPCQYIEKIENDYFIGFWIEISKHYCDSSVKDRMKVRQFFQSSILTLSYNKIVQHYNPIRQLEYYFLPLTKQEWALILSNIKNEN